MLPRDYYLDVEKPGFLKNILYGDSVSSEATTVVKFKNKSYLENLTFTEIWDSLIYLGCNVENINERIHIYI